MAIKKNLLYTFGIIFISIILSIFILKVVSSTSNQLEGMLEGMDSEAPAKQIDSIGTFKTKKKN